jgi:hypothetical protein
MDSKKSKIIALVFAFLMMGSTLTYWVMSLFNQPSNQLQIPQDKVLNYELNENQRAYLLKNYFTLIEYRYSTGCLECINMRNNLEKLTTQSDNQIYLQEIVSNGADKITITSLNGQKTITNPEINQTEMVICNVLLQRPIWCVTSQL